MPGFGQQFASGIAKFDGPGILGDGHGAECTFVLVPIFGFGVYPGIVFLGFFDQHQRRFGSWCSLAGIDSNAHRTWRYKLYAERQNWINGVFHSWKFIAAYPMDARHGVVEGVLGKILVAPPLELPLAATRVKCREAVGQKVSIGEIPEVIAQIQGFVEEGGAVLCLDQECPTQQEQSAKKLLHVSMPY